MTHRRLATAVATVLTLAAVTAFGVVPIEEPDLLHVYGLLPLIPEARRAFTQVVDFLR